MLILSRRRTTVELVLKCPSFLYAKLIKCNPWHATGLIHVGGPVLCLFFLFPHMSPLLKYTDFKVCLSRPGSTLRLSLAPRVFLGCMQETFVSPDGQRLRILQFLDDWPPQKKGSFTTPMSNTLRLLVSLGKSSLSLKQTTQFISLKLDSLRMLATLALQSVADIIMLANQI